MSDLYDGSGFDSSFGVGTAGWIDEQLMDMYLANHADDDPNEREPGELDDELPWWHGEYSSDPDDEDEDDDEGCGWP